VRALADDVKRRHATLDVIVNNAGIYARSAGESRDGYELTLAVNQLAPFALTHLLIGSVREGGRVVFVSSNVHRSAGGVDFDALAGLDGYEAYAVSKLMNVATAFELARRLDGKVAVNAMHPGVIGTKLLRQGFGASGGGDVARGAAGEVKLAIDPALDGVTGRYYDMTEESRASSAAQDRALQRRVYDWCVEKTGVAPI
jgi:NAD(P)-dependent dehydrogenase (short-subunit alcohol dehydrogenase family)